MYKMSAKYKCGSCNTSWHTKKTFDLHSSMCKLIHSKEHEIDKEFNRMEIPSQSAMFHYILHLTNKYETLEKKIAKLQQNTTRLRRKHIAEYIETLERPKRDYKTWLQSIEITDKHLDKLFETDIQECIKQIICDTLPEYPPICAFTQKQLTFYIYDEDKWRAMAIEEFQKFVMQISHKILRTYTKWAKEHYDELHANAKAEEQAMIKMTKANGMGRPLESRTSTIKKWLFSKLAVSLNQVDFIE